MMFVNKSQKKTQEKGIALDISTAQEGTTLHIEILNCANQFDTWYTVFQFFLILHRIFAEAGESCNLWKKIKQRKRTISYCDYNKSGKSSLHPPVGKPLNEAALCC